MERFHQAVETLAALSEQERGIELEQLAARNQAGSEKTHETGRTTSSGG